MVIPVGVLIMSFSQWLPTRRRIFPPVFSIFDCVCLALVYHVDYYFLQTEHLNEDHGLDVRHRLFPKLALIFVHLLHTNVLHTNVAVPNVHTGTLAPQ